MSFAVAPRPVVTDASVIVDMLLLEPRAAAAWQVWLEAERMLLAPPIVWFEVANALVRRRRMPSDAAMARLDLLFKVGLDTADRGYGGLATAVDLATRHGLSAYDASYLALAIEIDAELATLDRDLARAAVAEGVPLAIRLDD
jgi:predicted nucleic acid-binding protein